jgi:hypothetical protein
MHLEASFTLLEVSFIMFIVQASLTIISYSFNMLIVRIIDPQAFIGDCFPWTLSFGACTIKHHEFLMYDEWTNYVVPFRYCQSLPLATH